MVVKHCIVDNADISYTETGSGPTIVFVHGVYVTGSLWDEVVSELGEHVRCIVPTWPLGAHHPVDNDADLSAEATARRIIHFIEQLDLREVTVVANDTGGGLTLTALGDTDVDLSRVARLIFTNCDSYEHFPPGPFRHVVTLCRRLPVLGSIVLRGLATDAGQKFFLKSVCRSDVDADRQQEIFGEFATNSRTRAQAVRVTASLDPALTMRAAQAIEDFGKPVTLVWGSDDQLFPLDHAKRLAAAFPHARLIEVPDSSAFVMIDAPEQLAAEIAAMIDTS
jgi:pimeloyl-ACP methyl ester carboxylesterase